MRKRIVIAVVLSLSALLAAGLFYGARRPGGQGAEAPLGAELVSADAERPPVLSPDLFERIPVHPKLEDLAVVRVRVSVGESVCEGQIIAELDDAPLLSHLRELRDALRLAERAYREAAAGGEEAERQGRALDEVRSDMADLQMSMGYRYVMSPAAGIVLECAGPGDVVLSGTAPFVIGRPLPPRSPDRSPASGDSG